jgi:hypothetical protein
MNVHNTFTISKYTSVYEFGLKSLHSMINNSTHFISSIALIIQTKL